MIDKAFNLVDKPWILVTNTDGSESTVSIAEALLHAHEKKSLSGEIPSQDAAILRLLLAVLYAIFTRVDENGYDLPDDYNAADLWKRLWELKHFPYEVINGYLNDYRERFWLIHPTQPFWQVIFDINYPPVNKEGIKRGPTTLESIKLIGDIANQDNLFCGRTLTESISFAEAARWLVHLNAFDVSPGGNPGKEVKSIKGFGHPWPANIGLTWIGSRNLFETLMLNLVLKNEDKNWPDSFAWWETDPPCLTVDDLEQTEIPVPEGIVELMSMQYRYILLKTKNDAVTGFELWSGVRFESRNAFIEKMTPWRRNKDDNRYPQTYDPSKQLWRDFSALLQKNDDTQPGVIKWINHVNDNLFSISSLQIHTVGISYKKDTAVADIFSDSLSINSNLLTALGDKWIDRIIEIITMTENLVRTLGTLAEEIAKASGNGENSIYKRNLARENAYFCVDIPFRTWLSNIDPLTSDPDVVSAEWEQIARKIIYQLGEELNSGTGVKAFVGKIEGNNVFKSSTSFIKFKKLITYHINKNKSSSTEGG